ncbi:uncharacterized protein LOC125192451 isoform X2 [Salvia hispanica]|uniref:uncharacterized protein LOC125192451 isoform X2 n=1 Tax=Salvia hispanica TaxID=49212 RepID=UPI002009B644|nr:uncharacterized protein LOC125192451 isoform X2 [Salvia hispanica]
MMGKSKDDQKLKSSSSSPPDESMSKSRRSHSSSEHRSRKDDEMYTTEETKLLAHVYIDVSKDQRANFWWDVATNYNEFIPVGAHYRDDDQLREHWARMQKDVSKFIDIFTNCQKMQGTGHSLDDIRQQA